MKPIQGGMALLATVVALTWSPGARGNGPETRGGAAEARASGAEAGQRARAIAAQVRAEPQLRDDDIKVEVSPRRVTLTGRVDSAAERELAADLVRKGDPDAVLENQLVVENAPPGNAKDDGKDDGNDDGKNRRKRARAAVERAGDKLGHATHEAAEIMSDGWITSKVKSKLIADKSVSGSSIDVDTKDKVVTLRGAVRSEAERRRALRHARQTDGATAVVDELEIDSTSAGKPRP